MSERVDKDLGLEVAKVLGALICLVTGAILFVHSLTGAITTTDVDDQFSYILMVFIGAPIAVSAFFLVIERWTAREMNAVGFALGFFVAFILSIFIAPRLSVGTVRNNGIAGIIGSIVILIAKKPNFGPEANRRIYQSVGGWLGFILSLMILAIGLYIRFGLDISAYAGNGTYPENFLEAFVFSNDAAKIYYQSILDSSFTIVIGALIILVASVFRNRINLKIAGSVMVFGIVTTFVGFSQFQTSYSNLNYWFGNEEYPYHNVYELQLMLKDTGLATFGIVLGSSCLIALFLLWYASMSAKPMEKWRLKRDRFIAAAEVSIREQRLDKAIKYLELAAVWSSKVEEEDKAVELLTKVRQIEKKAIAMRKAEAAKKAKKQLAAQQAKGKAKPAAKPAPKKN
ncbi:MAG: hypothetical protein Kow0069_10410 [Promethearchaeota archaeon]